MKRYIRKTGTLVKNFILAVRPHVVFYWIHFPFFWIANILSLSKWISKQTKKTIYNDFFSFKRNYAKRYELFEYIIQTQELNKEPVVFLEFGVSKGNSLKWWSENLINHNNQFLGFDTFEGLPENWGTYKKGDMNSDLPKIDDNRVQLIKGLFQSTLPLFLCSKFENKKRKIVHLDADLFTSTLFVLTSIAPYLCKGDIFFFDEFNVPNHEFLAFKIFTESYYKKLKLLGAVNNFYQVAFIVE